ncbi:MAG: HD domain-containing protein [Eubacteriales bacterium]
MLILPEFPEIDGNKLIRMCIVHDFGEAITGDIPSFLKTKQHEKTEENAVEELLTTLSQPTRDELTALFAEMDALETKEAKLYKALDKLEAVIQHNESDISTWLPLEYDLQQTYAIQETKDDPFLKQLRELVLEDTLTKIRDAK